MPRTKAIPCSGNRPQRLILLLTGSIARPTLTPKARSSPLEHCQYMAEVGGSIPSRAYQFRGNRLKWLTGRAARGLGAAWRCVRSSTRFHVPAVFEERDILLAQSGRALP